MLTKKDLNKTLFIDIETAAEKHSFELLSTVMQKHWSHKSKIITKGDNLDPKESYLQKAGIYAEFAKIICISVGYFTEIDQIVQFRTTSFYGNNEQQLLQSFSALVTQHFNDPKSTFICGHNIKEFDIPFICRRMTIHGLDLPLPLNIATAKPWELKHLLDTLEMWKFGDYKSYTSLALLTEVLNLPTPKQDMKGSDVHDVYWVEKDIERISQYCQQDVIAVARIILRFMKLPQLKDENIFIIE